MQKWLNEKIPNGKDNGQALSLADVLTESNECLTRVVDLIYKSGVLYVDTAWMFFFLSLHEKIYVTEVVAEN